MFPGLGNLPSINLFHTRGVMDCLATPFTAVLTPAAHHQKVILVFLSRLIVQSRLLQVADINARELYLRPVTPQQVLARLPEDQLAIKVSREDLEVG